MEEQKAKQNCLIRKKMHSMKRRTGRKSNIPLGEVNQKKPSHLNLNRVEKPPSISPRAADQQAFRNYSTKGLYKGSSETISGNINQFNNVSQSNQNTTYKSIMNNTNLSSNNGIKSISTEPTHQATSNNTRHLLMSNPMSNMNGNKPSLLELDNIYLQGKGKVTSTNKHIRSKVNFPSVDHDSKPQSVKSSRIFSMLKSLDLQQYSRKFVELGYDNDLWRLAFLSKKQRKEFVQNLKPLPGHKDKLMSMFTMLDDAFEKEGMSNTIRQISTSKRNRQSVNTDPISSKDIKKCDKSNQNRKSSTQSNFQSKNEADNSIKPTVILKNKYLRLRQSVKTDINDKFISYFTCFQQKKKKKLKEILEKRNNVDYNCQLALNCIYNLNTSNNTTQSNFKSKPMINSIRKDKVKNRQKDSSTRSKYVKNTDVSQRYKSKSKIKSIATNNKKDKSNGNNSSANRSVSKTGSRVMQRNSKIKVKKTGESY